MKRLLCAAYAGFIVYIATFALFGPASPGSMERIKSERARIQSNLVELERLNARLQVRVQALKSDPETQSLEARALGYVGPREVHVRVSSLGKAPRYAVAGKILSLREATLPDRALPLILAAIAAPLAYILALARSKSAHRRA
jgi:cell division protein FtsB